jgi:hypothetical protein
LAAKRGLLRATAGTPTAAESVPVDGSQIAAQMAERYSIFTERSTGVNPFYLPPPPFPSPLGLCLAFLRFALLCFFFPPLLLCDALAGALGSPALYRWVCGPLARCVLFALGFGWGGLQARTLRPGADIPWARQLRAGGGGAPPAPAPAGAGTLLLVNSSSWLDPLVLLALHGAPLALPCAAGGGGFSAPSLRAALARALRRRPPPPAPAPPPPLPAAATVELLRRWAGPLAVQPEGAPSNGRALLRAAPRLAGALEGALAALGARAPRPRVLAISYARGGGGASPCFAGGVPPWRHALALLAAPGSAATVFALPEGADPLPADLPQGAPPGAWAASAAGAMEAMLRRADGQLRLVGLGEEDHAKFLAMVAERAGRG